MESVIIEVRWHLRFLIFQVSLPDQLRLTSSTIWIEPYLRFLLLKQKVLLTDSYYKNAI